MPVRRVDLNDYTLDPAQAAEDAAAVLRRGGVVALPTETVYGLAVKPDLPHGRDALTRLRGDASPRPLTPHLADPEDLAAYGVEPGRVGALLVRKLWPGPVALVFQVSDAARRRDAAELLGVSESDVYDADGRVTLRCPDDAFTRAVLFHAGSPAVVTRLGLGGREANTPPADDVLASLGVELAVDAGPTRYGRPSTVIAVSADGGSFEVTREGLYDRRTVERLLRTTVLFVCSGNTCRSPMAMAVGRKVLAEMLGTTPDALGDAGVDVVSAGTGTMPGMRATPEAADAVAALGGDLSRHRSQPLDVALIHRADLIVTMGQGHRDVVTTLVPSAAEKTVPLDPEADIEDPIGGDAGLYRRMAQRLVTLVRDRFAASALFSDVAKTG